MAGQRTKGEGVANNRGFTFIQLSILITVAALVLVTILPSSQTNLAANSITLTKMNTILAALRQFQTANGRLPCPADASQAIGSATYGVESTNRGSSTNCTGGTPAANFVDATNSTAIGIVPVRALNLSNDYALDGYGRDFTYAVDTSATSCWASPSLTGNIVVADSWVATNSTSTLNNTVLTLVSHGADGHGAWLPLTGPSGTAVRLNAGSTDTYELINAHLLATGTFPNPTTSSRVSLGVSPTVYATFVNKPPTSTFDDLVLYQSPLWGVNNLPVAVHTSTLGPTVAGPANGNYVIGQKLTFTATFGTAITVTGTPQLQLLIGANTDYANYTGGSGTTTLTFSYILQASDVAQTGTQPYGVTVYSPIDLNGQTATLSSTAYNPYCFLYFAPPSLSSVTVSAPSGIVIDTSTHCTGPTNCIDAVDSNNSRFQQWNYSTGVYYTELGSLGTGTSSFTNPAFITKDTSNNLYIVDSGNSRITKWTDPAYSSASAYSATIGSYGANVGTTSNAGQFNYPTGIGIDTTTNCASSTPCLWIADTANNRLQRCSTTGTCLTPCGTGSYNSLTLSNPTGLAIDASNNADVVDTSNNRIVQFSSTCVATTNFNSGLNNYFSGNGAGGALNNPTGIAVDSSGNIWVVDTGNNRVVKFNSSGVYVSAFGAGYNGVSGATGSSGSTVGKFNTPTGIAFDASNNLYVVDDNNNRMQECTNASSYLTCTSLGGTHGSGAGNFNF
jgi:hypothetical protein